MRDSGESAFLRVKAKSAKEAAGFANEKNVLVSTVYREPGASDGAKAFIIIGALCLLASPVIVFMAEQESNYARMNLARKYLGSGPSLLYDAEKEELARDVEKALASDHPVEARQDQPDAR